MDIIKKYGYSGLVLSPPYLLLFELAKTALFKPKLKIYKLSEPKESERNQIIFSNSWITDSYDITHLKEVFHGLFDDKLLKANAFANIMKSDGGSKLIIIERDSIPPHLKHYGGESASFSTGIYGTHPKNNDILIPLNNSSELIKSMILEETISAYEALGAKKIIISDITSVDGKGGGNHKGIKAEVNGESKKSELRKKKFGKGVFDPERALKDKFFIHDIPAIRTTLESRIHGNQTEEYFEESISLNVGLDVSVLSTFEGNLNFNYNRVWSFDVEFYDKTEMLSHTS
ncbi:hypothetical protein KIH41_04260 [Litoribacter ruber]|uniref:hypothetical protein n=1 Tax=Litoribacter ruber TaxID=702568 RepID=UPI001BDA946F|nr:hypothetical protein [Litoribacter ruber]MBT0810486.1 hypothetical protein [Litoribacter ruber]